jgi:hypothetical protein
MDPRAQGRGASPPTPPEQEPEELPSFFRPTPTVLRNQLNKWLFKVERVAGKEDESQPGFNTSTPVLNNS